jgi:hypothetical protein
MRLDRIPDARVETQRVSFFGGIDQTSPALDVKPGNALDAVNYEPGLLGGYKRIDGYERRDGRPAPSAATYTYLDGAFPFLANGTTVTGATSGASGIVVKSDGIAASATTAAAPGALIVSKVSGAFVPGETIKAGGVAQGQLARAMLRGYADAKNDAIALAAAADLYRIDIQAVPGIGPVLGAWMYKGVLYAFRNVSAGECAMYRESAAGWTRVTFGQQMQIQQPSFPVTTSSGAVNWTAHGLVAGALVQFSGTLPASLKPNVSYYVLNPTANTFQVTASSGGAAIAVEAIAGGLTCLPQAQQLLEGATVTGATSGATATIARAAVRTGAWASFGMTATLVLAAGTVNGAFQAGELLRVAGAPCASAVNTNTQLTLKPGGRFEFINYAFTGASASRRMYWADGVNPAFEFDGTTLCPIYTGMAIDTPKFIRAHKLKLFLSFISSVQHSGDGTPYAWTLLSGADEIGIGDDVTGMAVQAGDTLAIFGRNSSFQLNGSTNDDFTLLPISSEIGAVPYTVQTIGKTLALDDRGIISTDRSQVWGNFVQSTVSQQVQTLIDSMRGKAIGCMVYRSRNQYRLFANDGTGIIATFNDQGLIGITRLIYPVAPTCFYNCEDAAGHSLQFFAGPDGYVYQTDVGSSFDGQAITAYLRLPFNNINSPRLRKRFRKAVMDMSAVAYASIAFQPEFSYGSPDVGTHRFQTGETAGAGGYWDTSSWDGFSYDASVVAAPEFSIEGTGLNMGVLFYSSLNYDLGHILQGLVLHFSIRRLSR